MKSTEKELARRIFAEKTKSMRSSGNNSASIVSMLLDKVIDIFSFHPSGPC